VGHPTYLDAKAEGDHSMSEKREASEVAYDADPQDPRDMVKATLLESQFPEVKQSAPRYRSYRGAIGRPHFHAVWDIWPLLASRNRYPPADGRYPMRIFKGTKGTPTVALLRLAHREQGIAYGTRVLWQRSRHSSPRTGKPSTWRRAAGVPMTRNL
jgi:hypothetical protein